MIKKIMITLMVSIITIIVLIGTVIIKSFDNKKINILLYGLDGRNEDENERSDSIMLINVNFVNSSITTTSIPRDSYVEITCRDNKYDKINHSYAYGGTECLNETVKKLFEVDELKNVILDFDSVEQLINYFGLIELVPSYSFCQSDIKLNKKYCFEKDKKILIDGRQALAYMRNRKSLPNGDIDRVENQRQILKLLMRKFLNLSFIEKIKYFYYVKNIVRTDLEIEDFNVKSLINVNKLLINEYTLKGEGYIEDYYYYKLDNNFLEKIKKYYI